MPIVVPLVLLLPINLAVACVLFVSWAGFKYRLLFNESECQELAESCESLKQKVLVVFRGKAKQVA